MTYTPRTATGGAGNNSTITGSLPSGVAAGDFLVTKMVVSGGGSTYTQPTLTGVSGWTLMPTGPGSGANPLTSQSTSSGVHAAWYYRWATGTDPAPVWTFNATVLFKYCWTIEAYSAGPGSGAPTVYTAPGATGAAVTTNTAPSVTVATATYYAETYGSKSSTNASYTTPSGTTLRKATFGTGGGAADTLLVDSNGTATGTIGGHTTTAGTASAWQVSGLIVFPTAAVGGALTATGTFTAAASAASPQNTLTATVSINAAATVAGSNPALYIDSVIRPKYTLQLVDAPHLGSGSAVIGDLQAASGKSLIMSTPEGSQLTWTMPGYHPEQLYAGNPGIPGLWEMCCDAIFWRDVGKGPQKLWRGRVAAGNDTFDGDSYTIPWTAVDYKALFASKQLLDGDTLSFAASTDVAAIAWSLINTVQSRANGNMGITKSTDGWTGGGTANTGKTFGAAFVVTPGTDLKSALNTLLAGDTTAPAGAAAGFDWWLDTELAIHIRSRNQTTPLPPGRGTASTFVADVGGTVRSFTRTPLPDQYANVIRGDGGTGTTPSMVTAPTVGTDPMGRVERAIQVTVDSTQTTAQQNALVAQVTAEALYIGNLPVASYALVLQPGVWDPSILGVGDNMLTVIQQGRLNINGQERALSLQIDVSDDGDEKVTVTIQRPDVTHWQADALVKLGSRVRGLELRS